MKSITKLWHNSDSRDALVMIVAAWTALPLFGWLLGMRGADLYLYLACCVTTGLLSLLSLFNPLRRHDRLRGVIVSSPILAYTLILVVSGNVIAIGLALGMVMGHVSNWRKKPLPLES